MFLVDLEDEELKGVAEQVQRERKARLECEDNPLRLFFSSLSTDDLELARQEIVHERAARRQDRRRLAAQPAPGKRRKTARL